MLEIVLIWVLSKRIAAIARDKGHSAVPFVILFIVLWVGGEFTGAVVGTLMADNRNGPGLETYGMALLGAIVGACAGFMIVSAIPGVEKSDERGRWDDEEFDDDYPRRRRDDDRDFGGPVGDADEGIREGRPNPRPREQDGDIRAGNPPQ